MTIDQPPEIEKIKQISSRISELNDDEIQTLNECFVGHQGDEFMLGLITGFMNAHQILKYIGAEKADTYFNLISIYLSDYFVKSNNTNL